MEIILNGVKYDYKSDHIPFDILSAIINNEKKRDEYSQFKKERHKQQVKRWYTNNKTKLLEKYTCDICHGKYTLINKKIHDSTAKHKTAEKYELLILKI